MSENCSKGLYSLQLDLSIPAPFHTASFIIALHKHLYFCFDYLLLQNKLIQSLWTFFKKIIIFHDFVGNHKILLPIVSVWAPNNNELQNSLIHRVDI